jgi:hypothetical protein
MDGLLACGYREFDLVEMSVRSETWTRIRPFPDAPTPLRGNEDAVPKKLSFKRTRECHR